MTRKPRGATIRNGTRRAQSPGPPPKPIAAAAVRGMFRRSLPVRIRRTRMSVYSIGAVRPLGACLLLAGAIALPACRARTPAIEVPLPSRWFMGQRLAGGGVPVRARGRALEEARDAGLLVAAPGSWVSIGPFNTGGRITALALNPNVPDRIWIGAAEGGVFRTDDGGTTFTPLFDGQTALSIGALAVDPISPNTVYVGTGEDNGGGYSYDGEGVFRSADAGATWRPLGLAEVRRIGRVAVDPADPKRLFVAPGGDWLHRATPPGGARAIDS